MNDLLHFYRMDKSQFAIASLFDPSDEREFWWRKTPDERLAVAEFLRIIN